MKKRKKVGRTEGTRKVEGRDDVKETKDGGWDDIVHSDVGGGSSRCLLIV